ncbi:hypothetical protein LAV79_20410 [Peribacillus butanolivorans]|uniref:hypothetical protein n=1 Tax=Peribacillus butanolivorans TaxID=421767 RepID=UPI0030C9B16C
MLLPRTIKRYMTDGFMVNMDIYRDINQNGVNGLLDLLDYSYQAFDSIRKRLQ